MKKLIASTLLTGAIGLTVAHAAAVVIDFGPTAPNDTTWTQKNQTSGAAVSVAVDTYTVSINNKGGNFLSVPGSYAVSANTTWSTGTFNGNTGTALNEMEKTLGLANNSVDASIFLDGISNGAANGHTLTVSGLTADDLYTFYFIVGNGRGLTQLGMNAVGATYQGTGFTSQYYLNNAATAEYQSGVAIVPNNQLGLYKFDNVKADVNGEFKIGMGERGVINAMGFVAIPEPATLGMVVAFGGGLLFIRRKLMM